MTYVLICGRCRGSGREPGTVEATPDTRCLQCKGDGYGDGTGELFRAAQARIAQGLQEQAKAAP